MWYRKDSLQSLACTLRAILHIFMFSIILVTNYIRSEFITHSILHFFAAWNALTSPWAERCHLLFACLLYNLKLSFWRAILFVLWVRKQTKQPDGKRHDLYIANVVQLLTLQFPPLHSSEQECHQLLRDILHILKKCTFKISSQFFLSQQKHFCHFLTRAFI